jgi:hypothetical protein
VIIEKPSGNKYFVYNGAEYKTGGNPTNKMVVALAYAAQMDGWFPKMQMNAVCKRVGYKRLPNSWFPSVFRNQTVMERNGNLVRITDMGREFVNDMLALPFKAPVAV